MTRRLELARLAAGALLLGCAACREPPPPPTPSNGAPPAASAPPTTAAGSAPRVSSDVTVPGLRVRSGSIARDTLWGFSELTLDLARVELRALMAERGAPLPSLLSQEALAVVNGGYFEVDFKPSTWLKSGGVELAPKLATGKGGVLAIAGERSYVGDMAGLAFEPRFAVQSFPLIVEPGGNPGIHRDDGRRAARTVICEARSELRLIVIAAPRGEGPTLFEADALLRSPPPEGFGCSAALNLDGGPSSGVVFAPGIPAKQRIPVAPVAYGIAIVPR